MINYSELKPGDVVIRRGTQMLGLTDGKEYAVQFDSHGAFLIDDDGDRYESGTFKQNTERFDMVPQKMTAIEPGGIVRIESVSISGAYGVSEYTITVRTDEDGMKAVAKLQDDTDRRERLKRQDEKIEKAEALLKRLQEERESLI